MHETPKVPSPKCVQTEYCIVLYCLLYIPAIHTRSEPQDIEFVIVVLHLNKNKITIVYTYNKLGTENAFGMT